MPSQRSIIEIAGLTKDYRGLRPLRLRSLALAEADRVAVMGVDVVAAEVLVNLVTGASLPDSGEVRLFGQLTSAIATDTDWLASLDRLGLVSHRAVLLEGMSVLQNLALPLTLQLDPIPEDIRRTAVGLASDVGLDEGALDRPVAGLSQDVRMRIHLVRALALDPVMLLLEHPTARLERTAVRSFAEAVARVAGRRDLALLALTSDREFVEALGARALTLEPATGVLSGTRRWRWW